MTELEAPVAPGDVLDNRYRVERVLGNGAMGVIVAAVHVQLGHRVALKFLLPAALAKEAVVARFQAEGRALAQLRSEYVTKVHDVGQLPTGAPYIVMEYLEGSDLGDEIANRGSLPLEEVIDYTLQTCEALAEAHAIGIVHRDLKPKNLFLVRRPDGSSRIKILDFGISKMADNNMTQTSEIMGSPNYMSPEQLMSARDVDARTDIWALGVVIYEALSGIVPFEAESLPQLCTMIMGARPGDLAVSRPDLPPQLIAVVNHCLEKKPEDRFQHVSELANALLPFGGERARLSQNRFAPPSSKANSGGLSMPQASASSANSSGAMAFAPTALGESSNSWMSTKDRLEQKKKRPAWIIPAVAVGSLALVGGALALRPAPKPVIAEPAATAVKSQGAAGLPIDPVDRAHVGGGLVIPSASATPTASVSASNSATRPLGSSPIGAGKHHLPPKGVPTTDELPNSRK